MFASGVNVGGLRGVCRAGRSTGLVGADVLDRNHKQVRNQRPMSQSIHFVGLDVHKESVAVSIAPSDSTEVRHYGTIGGQLKDTDQLIKRLQPAAPGCRDTMTLSWELPENDRR